MDKMPSACFKSKNMFYSENWGLNPGDQIVEYITPLGIAKHFAIYLGWDHEGTEWVIENKKGHAVRLVNAAEYFGQILKIDRIQKYTGTNTDRRQLVQRALNKIGQPYNLINYNCEHFVTEVTTGLAVSRQVQNALGIGITFFLLRLLIRE